ncbi:putative damage-inducible protein DinB [Paenibacillus taihuensis]|uniref:Putative damage-inducible protein DinB n=1 Tax=Paenibacillus taihuensis TaxID=1156355 RepID=A0A3D9Q614_9BACL|nr:DinB family protein [Paenibacillus taihuensis]REE56438.1 putative damage-inducible protein DinB [Paenibacillus taihuensis]
MSYEAVLPIWRVIRGRFQKMVQSLKEEELHLAMSPESPTIAHMIRHNAEVEYMFADWFFGRGVPECVTYMASGSTDSHDPEAFRLEALIAFSAAADAHLTEAMRELGNDLWDVEITSKIGPSTPREALGRTIYHTGLHAGQIALIRKHAPQPAAGKQELVQ